MVVSPWTPWSAKPLPLPSNSRPEPIEGGKVVVRIGGTTIFNYPERGGGKASSAIKYGGIVRAGQSAPVTMKLLTKSLNRVRLPVLSGFGRAIQHLGKSARGLRIGLQHYLFPPAPTGLVAHSDGHRVGERKSPCPNQDGANPYRNGAKAS